jgi:3D (Asp-Asp-Asp) domain-containing protein
VIRVERLQPPYNGTYVVRDTGAKIRGRRIDLYMPNCDEAIRFGRREALVGVVRD